MSPASDLGLESDHLYLNGGLLFFCIRSGLVAYATAFRIGSPAMPPV